MNLFKRHYTSKTFVFSIIFLRKLKKRLKSLKIRKWDFSPETRLEAFVVQPRPGSFKPIAQLRLSNGGFRGGRNLVGRFAVGIFRNHLEQCVQFLLFFLYIG